LFREWNIMEQIELTAAPRQVIGKQVKALRRSGQVPAILYGRNVQPVALQVDARTLNRVLSRVGQSRLIKLNVEGREPQMALARDIHREPITGNLYHVDFMAVSMTERIKVQVQIALVGESPAVQRGEGVLVHALNSVDIECLPGDLIDVIRLDVSKLDKVDAQITVKDLPVPEGIQVLANPDEMVVRVTPVREEKVEEVVPVAEAAAEVEVIEKGKKEEEVPEETK
jgi:large subunit ribosomal protein L25